MDPNPTVPEGGARLDPARQRAVLIILSAAAMMVLYVETMIIPGLTRFQTFYGNAPLTSVTWILTAYLLVGVAFTPIAGKLGDIYGKKRVLITILSVYFVAVTVAGFTPNIGDALGMTRGNELYLLIGVRAIQGEGAAMFPLAFAMIGDEFPKDKIAGAQGLVSAMFAIGASVGLFVGAWITQTYGWQFTYHTVIPVAGLVLVMAILLLRESRIRLPERIDVPGAATLSLSLTFFLLGLTEGPTWGWGNWDGFRVAGVPLGSPEFLVISALLVAAFILWETHCPEPIVDFAKLGERNIVLSNAIGILAGVAMFTLFVGFVARVEAPAPVGLGKSPLDLGYYSLPASFATLICAPLVGRSITRLGPKFALLLGSVLIMVGGLFLAEYNDAVIDFIVGPIPIMLGVIFLFIAMTNIVVVTSKPQETGIQTGMNQTFRNLGTAMGPVIASTILASLLATYTTTILVAGHAVPVEFRAPSTGAFQLIFLLMAALGAAALVLSTMVHNYRLAPARPSAP
jgi:MFS family permease